MPRVFARVRRRDYRVRWKDLDEFDRVATVPAKLKWAPLSGPQNENVTVLRSTGDYYRLVRWRDTGAVVYFKRRVTEDKKSPAEQIDAEPTPPTQRFRKGTHAWFIDAGRWFLVRVVDRTQEPNRITIAPATGFDAERVVPWPFAALIEFPASPNNTLFGRLRRLAARYS